MVYCVFQPFVNPLSPHVDYDSAESSEDEDNEDEDEATQ